MTELVPLSESGLVDSVTGRAKYVEAKEQRQKVSEEIAPDWGTPPKQRPFWKSTSSLSLLEQDGRLRKKSSSVFSLFRKPSKTKLTDEHPSLKPPPPPLPDTSLALGYVGPLTAPGMVLDIDFKDIDSIVDHKRTHSSDQSLHSLVSGSPVFTDPFITPKPRSSSLNKSIPPIIVNHAEVEHGPHSAGWDPPESWVVNKEDEQDDYSSSEDSFVGRHLEFRSHTNSLSLDAEDDIGPLRSMSTTSESTTSSKKRLKILSKTRKATFKPEPPGPNAKLTDSSQRKYTIRIYRANNTYHVVSVGFQVTVADLTAKLRHRLLASEGRESHRLYLREKGRERILAQTERPADIVRRRLEQAGYDISDGLELLAGEGLAFLLKFVYKSQLLGPAEEDIKLDSYTNVDLSSRSLRTIPVNLHIHAHQIISLTLSRNPMLEIPLDFIQSCTALRQLRLSHMAIKKVPHSVKSSSTLLRLDISCNRIVDLQDAYLDEISGLMELYAQNNRIEKLPWYFPRMKNLVVLNISNNKFRRIHPIVCQLEALKDLDVSFNTITELPDELGELRNLERFVMVGNQISRFPSSVQNLVSLKYLDCRRNTLGDLEQVCLLPNLQTLYADHNALHSLDLSLGPRLECFDASRNEITKLRLTPAENTRYSLSTLDISHAKLSNFDDLALAQLTTLRTLRLDHNKFTSIPETLGELVQLEYLSCADNALGSLPISIGRLEKLETLDVHANNLTEVPVTIWNCKGLCKINLTSNLLTGWPHPPIPVTNPPPSISSSPNGEILSIERKTSASSLTAQRLPPLAVSLEKLHLGENAFTDDALHPLTIFHQLKVLNLAFNDLQDMPPSFFKNFTKLEEVYLGGNKLSSIPTEDLYKLSKLSVLYLNGNRLQTLPQELGKVKSLSVLDVGSNLLRYNINNWEFDWNWNFNKNLKYLNLSGNKRLQIKSDSVKLAGGNGGNRFSRDYQRQTLAGFTDLTQLRVLGLMDVTITTTGTTIPDESDDRRVRTSQSTVCGMSYGIADTLGKNDNLHMIDLVHEFPPSDLHPSGGAVFASFGRAIPPKGVPPAMASNRLAKYLHDRFVEVLLSQEKALRFELDEGIPDALRRTFLKLNQDLHDTLFSTRKMSQTVLGLGGVDKGGASGVVAYFKGRKLYVANAGSALAVICRGGSAVALSQRHDPYDRDETHRIRSAEGWISPAGFLNDDIDVSRSFGFFWLLPMVNARPFVSSWDLTEHDEFVIVANRGLWDYISYQTAVDIARREGDNTMIAAQKLRDLAMSYGADGSTMIMVIFVADLFKNDRMRKNTVELTDPYYEKPLPHRPKDQPRIWDSGIRRLPPEVPPPTGHIALVFTDIRNSTYLWNVNPGTHTAIRMHHSLLRRQLRFCGGYEVKTEGDSFMCSFPSTLSAVWWCLTVQQQLLHEDWPLEILECSDGRPIHDANQRLIARGLSVRMGIHCGSPLCELDPTTHRMDYFGPMVNRAARIEGNALGGEIRVSVDVLREIDSKVFGSEPVPDLQAQEARDAIKRIGIVVVPVGEVKLKGLEAPEMISVVYPAGLEGRQYLDQELPVDPKLDPNSRSRVPFSVKQMWDLGMLCLRLEALATKRTFRVLPERKGSTAGLEDAEKEEEDSRYLYGDPSLLLPPMNEKSSDADLMLIMDSLSGRIENAISSLSGLTGAKEQLASALSEQSGLDTRTLQTVLDILKSL